MVSTSEIEKSKIFIWGDIGQDIKDLDKLRMMAIAHDNPSFHLSCIANRELFDILDKMDKEQEITPDIMKDIKRTNELDNSFREIAEFLHESDDMLSTGSFIVGQKGLKSGIMDITGVDENDI